MAPMNEGWRVPAWAIVREARNRAGLTQRELAERAGTSQAAVARYERGRGLPSLDTLDRLVEACGFDLRIHLEPILPDSDNAGIELRLAMSVENRLRSNDDISRLVAELRRG